MKRKIIIYETKPYDPSKSIPAAKEMVNKLSQCINISARKIEILQDNDRKKNHLDELIEQYRNTYGEVMIVFPSLSSISEDREIALNTLEKILRKHILVGGWEPELQAAIMEATYRISDAGSRRDMDYERIKFLMTLIGSANIPVTVSVSISAE